MLLQCTYYYLECRKQSLQSTTLGVRIQQSVHTSFVGTYSRLRALRKWAWGSHSPSHIYVCKHAKVYFVLEGGSDMLNLQSGNSRPTWRVQAAASRLHLSAWTSSSRLWSDTRSPAPSSHPQPAGQPCLWTKPRCGHDGQRKGTQRMYIVWMYVCMYRVYTVCVCVRMTSEYVSLLVIKPSISLLRISRLYSLIDHTWW